MLALCRGSLQWILGSKVHGKSSSEITRLRLVTSSWVVGQISFAVRFLFVSCRPLGSSWPVGKLESWASNQDLDSAMSSTSAKLIQAVKMKLGRRFLDEHVASFASHTSLQPGQWTCFFLKNVNSLTILALLLWTKCFGTPMVLGTKAWRTAQSWTPCSRLATRHRLTGRRRTSASCLQSKQSRQSRVSAKGRKQNLLLARREPLATRLGKTPVSRFASLRIRRYIHTSTHPDIHHMSIRPDIHHMSIHPDFHHMSIHPYIPLSTHPYIDIHAQTFTYSFIHSFIPSFIHSFIHSVSQSVIQSFIHSYMHTYIRTYIHSFIHSFIHPSIHSYMHACIHTYIHTYIHTHTHTYIHTYIRTYVRTYVRTCKDSSVSCSCQQLYYLSGQLSPGLRLGPPVIVQNHCTWTCML